MDGCSQTCLSPGPPQMARRSTQSESGQLRRGVEGVGEGEYFTPPSLVPLWPTFPPETAAAAKLHIGILDQVREGVWQVSPPLQTSANVKMSNFQLVMGLLRSMPQASIMAANRETHDWLSFWLALKKNKKKTEEHVVSIHPGETMYKYEAVPDHPATAVQFKSSPWKPKGNEKTWSWPPHYPGGLWFIRF